MISMTITALFPKEVPTMNFATGRSATIRIINGMLLKKFTIKPRIVLIHLFSQIPPLSVTERTTPMGSPRRYENAEAIIVIYTVSQMPSWIRPLAHSF